MDEYKLTKVKVFISVIVIILSMFLIVNGHNKIGINGLMQQLVGLGILLLLLFVYNRPYSK